MLIRNATIWTGDLNNATVLYATDILLDRGLIIDIGKDLGVPSVLEGAQVDILDAHGGWVTPGIFDMVSLASRRDMKAVPTRPERLTD